MTMGPDDAQPPSIGTGADLDDERHRPPLPPRPGLQSKPTTAISSMNIQTLSFPDGTRGTFSTDSPDAVQAAENGPPSRGQSTPLDDNMSIASFAPTARPAGDLESLLVGENSKRSPAWALLRSQSAAVQPFESETAQGYESALDSFNIEFDPIPGESKDGMTDDDRLAAWKSKLKHYMILSSAGKPIWSRHGDLGLINSSMGVVQTIISFYEGSKNPLQSFSAGSTKFVIMTQGPLYFVAISSLGESDQQLRFQLDALYMQILSTLTLPTLTRIFVNRPSSDLRKPLEGTESLLSSLADSFTRGSPSALLGALECLKLRKSHRHAINNVFLKNRADNLLYGLIVAGGKLVSVIRPRRHSLHPSDLQLIFNMLFESGGIKAAGGENWIPLCLPAFNNKGYLYMYVSWLGVGSDDPDTQAQPNEDQKENDTHDAHENDTAIILISPDKESFFALHKMRDDIIADLHRKNLLTTISQVTKAGRPHISTITNPSSSMGHNRTNSGAPSSPPSKTTTIATTGISHFLFKSRANVQFTMPSLNPHFTSPIQRRKLMSLYHSLHASVHARHSHLKVLHRIAPDESTSLAWITPVFELYCVAGPNTSRAVLTQGANKIMQWAKREEERLFIIGGGVF